MIFSCKIHLLKILLTILLIFSFCSKDKIKVIAKERLIKVPNSPYYLTHCIVSVNNRDSLIIFPEDENNNIELNSPIVEISIGNTIDYSFRSKIIEDTIFLFYKNNNLQFNQKKHIFNNYTIKLDFQKPYIWIKNPKHKYQKYKKL